MGKKRAQKLHECLFKGECIFRSTRRKKPTCLRPSSCSDWGAEVD